MVANKSAVEELVYDVGAHNGDDTAHYLEMGYRVVSVEADPILAEKLRRRFEKELNAGRLTVANIGIADSEGALPFYLCPEATDWNSFDKEWASSRGMETVEVSVPARRFGSLLAEYGVPLFLKVDIEGSDALCIRALSDATAPEYVSFEADADSSELIIHLYSIGYSRFALVNQYDFTSVSLPTLGSWPHVLWSAKQAARRLVRTHPALKRTVSAMRPRLRWKGNAEGFRPGTSSGPSPMERTTGWQDIWTFLHTWTCVITSGMITSAWFDIHATRTLSSRE